MWYGGLAVAGDVHRHYQPVPPIRRQVDWTLLINNIDEHVRAPGTFEKLAQLCCVKQAACIASSPDSLTFQDLTTIGIQKMRLDAVILEGQLNAFVAIPTIRDRGID